MSEKPEALRLADAMWAGRLGYGIAGEIAAELRRLHTENERLNAVALQAQNAAIDLTKKNERLHDELRKHLLEHERLREVVDALDAGDPSWKLMRAALRREPSDV